MTTPGALLVTIPILVGVSAMARVPERGPLESQAVQSVESKSSGCLVCHTDVDEPSMHPTGTVLLGCTDCHGGDARGVIAPGTTREDPAYERATLSAHVSPRHPKRWPTSANPQRSYTALNDEPLEFIRFVNPGDLRVADTTCGTAGCHAPEVHRVRQSMMAHGAMLWGAALYNNGAFPLKDPWFGESYSPGGGAQRLQTIPQPSRDETRRLGVLPFLNPLPRFEVAQAGNILRVFERGDDRLSFRGLGTFNRTDPVFQGLQRTRLLDPTLWFLGTNDHPGDYRSSGCTACHVVYANDRDPFHSGPYARFGHLGTSAAGDPTIPKNERGHPIRHVFTRAIPSSQCVVCHVHPGTSFANQYFGYTWWDNETHGEHLYPRRARNPTPEQRIESLSKNPEAAALRGLWSDLYPEEVSHAGEQAGPDFLARTSELNPNLHLTKLADFHGHGWLFRAAFKQDRKGRLLDARGEVVPSVTAETMQQAIGTPVAGRPHGGAGIPVHLKDIHLEKGMHCVDCHFEQDVHGNGRLYGEVRNAIEIECVDCHGSIRGRATLRTSGPAAPPGGTDLSRKLTPWGRPRFEWRGDVLIQSSMVEPDRDWNVVQVLDTITPGTTHYNERSRLAKTIRRDGRTWGDVPPSAPDVRATDDGGPAWGTPALEPLGPASNVLAHRDDAMACYTCHTSWMTSCFGCHLPMQANERRPGLHYEGDETLNWTQYNYQVLRDDVFMLGRDGTVKRNRIVPVRSSSAVLVGSQNRDREWLYSQQQTISSEGHSGQAFNPHFPHAVRGTETKQCADCHPSQEGDNNAWMAQVLLQGTNFVNFIGRFVYVGQGEKGLEAVVVTERDEPQAVIGSRLHALAYPDRYDAHVRRERILPGSLMYEHPGPDVLSVPWRRERIQSLQLRGEYLYSANGPGGLRVYDVANIDNKKNPERITTSVISPLGQRLYVRTKDAAAVLSPTTLAVDPTRPHLPENEEQPIHPLYGYIYVLDRVEGLIVVPAATLLDGNPANNFLERARLRSGADAFDGDGLLVGAHAGQIAGRYAYVCSDAGLVTVDIDDPLTPRVTGRVEAVRDCRAVTVQFQYAFVVSAEGLQVLDLREPHDPRLVAGASVPLPDARDVYVARTYAYVAAGAQGLAIIDVERPTAPTLDQIYDADGSIDDANQVRVGMTNASLFAYLADGRNGLRVIQLTSADTPGYQGFSPRPRPDLPGHGLIATYRTHGPALAISKGLDRDRAVDEAGNQLAVFGRRGARPLTLDEQRRLYEVDGRQLLVPATATRGSIRNTFGDPTSR